MEKKEYKQPEVKVVEVEEIILSGSDPTVDVGEGGLPAATKCGTFNFDNDFDTEW